MKRPNLLVNHHNGSRNYVMPRTIKPSILLKFFAWVFQIVLKPNTYYDIYFKSIVPSDTIIKKGDVYLDKTSGIKLIVLRYSTFNDNKRKSIQFCTLYPLKEKEKNKIELPLYLKYLGNTK